MPVSLGTYSSPSRVCLSPQLGPADGTETMLAKAIRAARSSNACWLGRLAGDLRRIPEISTIQERVDMEQLPMRSDAKANRK
jgi:hypothetical protein